MTLEIMMRISAITVTTIRLVYVAGPYRASTYEAIDENIKRARIVGQLVAGAGVYPVIPHLNTAHFEGCALDEFWIPATLELCRRCDGIVMMRGWQQSEGSRGEHKEMQRLHRRVFYEGECAADWTREIEQWAPRC